MTFFSGKIIIISNVSANVSSKVIRRCNYERLLSFGLALVLVLSLAGCSSGGSGSTASQGVQDTQADKGLEVMGDNVTYDPTTL